LPELDERLGIIILMIAGLAALFMKEITLPVPLVALGLVGLVVRSRRVPELPLYLLTAWLPFSRLVSEPNETPSVLVTASLIAWIAVLHAARQRRAKQPMVRQAATGWVIALLILLSIGSWLRAAAMYGAWYLPAQFAELLGWCLPMSLWFLAVWVVPDARTLKTLVAIMLVAVTVVAAMAAWDYFSESGGSFESSRISGITDDPNRLGAFFAMYAFLFLGVWLTLPTRGLGWLMLIPLLLCARGVMVTFSRGAYLACVAGGLVTLWFRHKLLFVAAALVGAVMLTHPVLLPGGIRYRLQMTLKPSSGQAATAPSQMDVTTLLEASAAGRVEIWQASTRIIQDHPWGVGFGAFPNFLLEYTNGRMEFRDAHNAFLMLAAEMGLVTVAVFVVLLMMIAFHAAWLVWFAQDPLMRALGLGMVGGLVGMIVANQFSYCFGSQEVTGYFWLLSGLTMRAVLLERQAGQPVAAVSP
jgi:O-antigen ligase